MDECIWAGDLLDRAEDAKHLERFLTRQVAKRTALKTPGSFVLNIDARWGLGKSFFLTRFAEQLRSKGHMVAEVNAWRDDFCDDPIIPILSAIDKAVRPKLRSKSARNALGRALKGGAALGVKMAAGGAEVLARKVIGDAVQDIKDIVKTDENSGDVASSVIEKIGKIASEQSDILIDAVAAKSISNYRKSSGSIEDFKKNIAQALGNAGDQSYGNLFVLIDELDRCRPSYAILLLERVKHLFDVERVVFIIATDSRQLAHVVRGVYGPNFDGERYLTKFFNQTYVFQKPRNRSFANYYASLIDPSKICFPLSANIIIEKIIDVLDPDYRTLGRWWDMVSNFQDVWPYDRPADGVLVIAAVVNADRERHTILRTLPDEFRQQDFRVAHRHIENGQAKDDFQLDKFYADLLNISGNLERLVTLDPNRSLLNKYARVLFSKQISDPEFNFRSHGQPISIQRLIPDIVQTAGRFVGGSISS